MTQTTIYALSDKVDLDYPFVYFDMGSVCNDVIIRRSGKFKSKKAALAKIEKTIANQLAKVESTKRQVKNATTDGDVKLYRSIAKQREQIYNNMVKQCSNIIVVKVVTKITPA